MRPLLDLLGQWDMIAERFASLQTECVYSLSVEEVTDRTCGVPGSYRKISHTKKKHIVEMGYSGNKTPNTHFRDFSADVTFRLA